MKEHVPFAETEHVESMSLFKRVGGKAETYPRATENNEVCERVLETRELNLRCRWTIHRFFLMIFNPYNIVHIRKCFESWCGVGRYLPG